MPVSRNVYVIFYILRQLPEKYLGKKDLFFQFADLEKNWIEFSKSVNKEINCGKGKTLIWNWLVGHLKGELSPSREIRCRCPEE